MRSVTLNDGTSMPSIGWGNMGGAEKAVNAGAAALRAGIRHIDSAQIYRTEAQVPQAIAKAGLKRDDVYVTTKSGAKSTAYGTVFNMPDGPKLHSLEEVKASVARSLAELTFIPNLLLIHNPFIPAPGQIAEFWGWLESLVEDGTLKGCSLGVSNFRPVDLEEVMKVARIKPVVNQIEFHPFVYTHVESVIDLHRKYNIITQAYASLVPTTRHPTGGSLKPILSRIAQNLSQETSKDVDESGVLQLWVMTKGGVCITSSSSEERNKKMGLLNDVRDLNAGEMREIDEAGRKVHFRQWEEHLTIDFPNPNLPPDA